MRLQSEDDAPVAFELLQQANGCERTQSASAIYTIHTDMNLRTVYSGLTVEPRLPVPHRFST